MIANGSMKTAYNIIEGFVWPDERTKTKRVDYESKVT